MDRFGIGGNAPPLSERLALDHAELVREAEEAAALVPPELRAIASDEEAEAFTDTAATIKGILAQADAAFKVEKAPWLEGARTVDGFFNAVRDPLKAAAGRVVAALNARANAILAAQRKAEAEEAERARKAAAAEMERMRKEAEAFDEAPPAVVAPVYVAPAPVRDVARVVSSSTGNKASVNTKWVGEVEDLEKLPRHYMLANQAMIDAAIKGGVRDIPGVRIYETAKAAIRR